MTEPPKPPNSGANLYERIRARFAPLGGADDLVIPPREPGRDPPNFDTTDYDPPPDRQQEVWPGAMSGDGINSETNTVGAEAAFGPKENDA